MSQAKHRYGINLGSAISTVQNISNVLGMQSQMPNTHQCPMHRPGSH